MVREEEEGGRGFDEEKLRRVVEDGDKLVIGYNDYSIPCICICSSSSSSK